MTQPLDRRLHPWRDEIAAASLKGQVKSERFVDGQEMAVVAAAAPLHRAASDDAPLDTQVLMGERFVVYDEADGWCWGQSCYDDYVGYVPSDCLSISDIEPDCRVAALRTFLYPEPDLKSPPLALVSMCSKLAVTGRTERFLETPLGYVFEGHVEMLDMAVSDYTTVAQGFVGTPYLWGGKESLGLDCSGLVQVALERAGISALRDTDMQEAALGVSLTPEEMEEGLCRGDLVFWKGHVGIMVDQSRMVHANATAMAVTIDGLQDFAAKILPSDGPITSVKRIEA